MEAPDGFAGSWLKPGPDLVAVVMRGVSQQMKDHIVILPWKLKGRKEGRRKEKKEENLIENSNPSVWERTSRFLVRSHSFTEFSVPIIHILGPEGSQGPEGKDFALIISDSQSGGCRKPSQMLVA